MVEEIVDIVDEQNQVIGQVGKSEAHQKGLLHRCIIAEVINVSGEWALVLQASDRQDAGQYVSPVGGHIRLGELEIAALKREAFEEMGLTEFTYKFVGKGIYHRKVIGRDENHYFILYEIYTSQTPKINHESDSYKWFTKEELKKEYRNHPEIFGAAFHFVFKRFYQQFL